MLKERLKILIYKYLDDRLTEAEMAELRDYAVVYPQVWTTIRRLQDDRLLTDNPRNIDLSKAMAEVKGPASRKHSQWPPSGYDNEVEKKGVSMTWKILTAALLSIAVAGFSLLIAVVIFKIPTPETTRIASLTDNTAGQGTVIPNPQPGGCKAILTGYHEQVMLLDSHTVGRSPIPGMPEPMQTFAGVLSYVPPGRTFIHEPVTGSPTGFHTLTAPKGGFFTVILPDGSEAILNCSSSLRYPVHFSGNHREVVVLGGEVLFNVLPDAEKPFLVKVKGKTLHVLGTRFSITDYDSSAFQTVLLAGKVRIEDDHHQRDLNPNQQLDIDKTGKWTVRPAVNPEGADAWTRGEFDFSNMPLSEILDRLALWYNLEVDRSGVTIDPPRTLLAGRNQPLLNFLSSLENGQVHLRTDGKKIIVSP
jgi:hypothetical protein